MDSAAIAVERSGNSKIGIVSATYVTQASCPTACKFHGSGCYAESGMTAFTTRRLNESHETEPDVIAWAEANEIAKLTGRLPLRVHVVGDCPTDNSARIVSIAMSKHQNKHGMPAWTYTHAWRTVSRTSWGNASVQASCETVDDVTHARYRGYATVLVVDHFESDKRYTDSKTGADILPCPQQTGKAATCNDCRLCMGPALERRRQVGLSIGFAVHGSQKRKASEIIAEVK